jgi:Protein of unknown function (DUF4079)
MPALISSLQDDLTQILEPIAAQFRGLELPNLVTQWGHPLMMAIVVFVMGSFVGLAGWRGRLVSDADAAVKSRLDHRKLAPWLFLFIAAGYTGGVLSLLVQQKSILDSPHFWTGSAVIVLLATNGLISATQFAGNRASLRSLHAYLGSAALCLLFAHAALGLKLGLSL